ncbi:hypothetical protein IWX90DRAFT_428626 [Phyllosticta citrichinensis]|uniref:NAD(P)-binding protein n=1 Tax=Phyllosticta citrichinensis TaxID=1130410 RepID=A0ABR1Y0Q3_9PEZI
MPLTILSDDEVRSLLHSLTRQDILEIQQSLGDALHYYSTASADENDCCSSYQPQRTHMKRKDGSTTLFMPASSQYGLGVKIVTLPDPALTASSETKTSEGDSGHDLTVPRGSLTLLDAHGFPRALINAEEITAFRTALASTMLFKKRRNVHDVTIFGAGKQAYWHARLALLLRGDEIHHLNIIARTFDRAKGLVQKLYNSDNSPNGALHRPQTAIITPAHTEYERYLKSTVRSSSAIFMTTPSLEPLFPASYLTNHEGRRKGRYIAAIGSYKPHMCEIHPDILRQAVAPQHGQHFHKHAKEGGAIVVDSVEACLREAGELIQAKLEGHEVVELGELLMLKRRDAEIKQSMSDSQSSTDGSGIEVKNNRPGENDGGLRDWLERGNVIYKAVGLGLMDVVVGANLVTLADQRSVGTRVDKF